MKTVNELMRKIEALEAGGRFDGLRAIRPEAVQADALREEIKRIEHQNLRSFLKSLKN